VFIYLITNSANGKYYVGQTVNAIAWRWSSHKSSARRSDVRQGGCKVLNRAINKYGHRAFIVEQLAEASNIEQLNILEQLWIWALNSTDKKLGYNMTFGGAGVKGTKEVRDALAAKALEQYADPIKKARHDEACANADRFVGWTDEERRLSMTRDTSGAKNPMFGKPGTSGHKGCKHTPEQIEHIKEGIRKAKLEGRSVWITRRRNMSVTI
jgi:group I intron endonuclease